MEPSPQQARGRSRSSSSQGRNVRQNIQPDPELLTSESLSSSSESSGQEQLSPATRAYNSMKQTAQTTLTNYLAKNNKLSTIPGAVFYLGRFFDDLFQTKIINRELALTYILQLEKIGIANETIALLRNKASFLTNTSIPEPELIQAIYDLEFVVKGIKEIYAIVNDYTNELIKELMHENMTYVLAHNLRILMLILFITKDWDSLTKGHVIIYLKELKPYLKSDNYNKLYLTINEKLTNTGNGWDFVGRAIRLATAVNVIIHEKPIRPIPEEILEYLDEYKISYPEDPDIEKIVNDASLKYFKFLYKYFWNDIEHVLFVIRNIQDVVEAILKQKKQWLVLIRKLYEAMFEHYSDGVLYIMAQYINNPVNDIDKSMNPDMDIVTTIKYIKEYHEIIDLVNTIKLRKFPPLRKLGSRELSPISESLPEGMVVPEIPNPKHVKFIHKLFNFRKKHFEGCVDRITEIKKYLNKAILKERILISKAVVRILDVNPEYCLAACFKYWSGVDSRAEQMRFSFKNVEDYTNFEIKYLNSKGIGVGVTRDFFTNCCKELIKYGVFVKGSEGEAGVDRYVMNERFIPDERFREEAEMDFNEIGDFALFFEFVGRLLGLVLVNNIGLEFGLSFGVLYGMLTGREVKSGSAELVGCYMMDRPVEATGLINLFKTPELIGSVGLEYDKQITLPGPLNNPSQTIKVSETVEVKSENYIEYLETKAFETLGKSINALVEGFRPMNKLLKMNKNINLYILDKLISFEPVTMETVGKLIQNIQQNSPESVGKESILKILKRQVRGSKSNDGNFLEWVRGLLGFWASSENYIPSLRYNVVVVEGEDRYPESHTCFSRIDIPRGYAGDAGKVYRKLKEAIAGMETGIGKFGGGK